MFFFIPSTPIYDYTSTYFGNIKILLVIHDASPKKKRIKILKIPLTLTQITDSLKNTLLID